MRQPINIRLFELALGLSFGVLWGHYNSINQPQNADLYLYLGLIFTLSYLICFQFISKLWWLCRLWFFSLWIGMGSLHYVHQRPAQLDALESKDIGPVQSVANDSMLLADMGHKTDSKKVIKLQALVLTQRLKPWGKTHRYLANYHQSALAHPSRVIVLSRDSLLNLDLGPDKTLWTSALPKAIEKAENPGGFDPQSYYHSQGIELKVALSFEQVYCWDLHPLSLTAKAQKINARLANYWRQAPLSEEAKALGLAIILGQTEDLTTDLKTQFAAAGALHVLALSGLHVGMLVLLFQWGLRPIKWFPFGAIIYPMVLLGFLWSYALICGLSPSITRAVCMFSIWQFGQIIRRPISGSNSVLLTYVLLLWWNPYWLFSVGFQLSFTAVMALTYIPSLVQRIGRPKNKIYRYFTELSVVGVAAQIGVGPLSVYYFHQFPLLFWLSNLLVLPLMTPLIILGLMISIGNLIAPIPKTIWLIWDQLLHLILSIVQWISSNEHLLLKGLNLSWVMVCGYYLIALFLWWGLQHPWLSQRRVLKVYLPHLCCMLGSIYIFHVWTIQSNKPEFALLHRYKNTLIIANTPQGYRGLIKGKNNTRLLRDWSNHYGIPLTGEQTLPPIMSFDGCPLVVIDNNGLYPDLTHGIIILTNNADIHFESLVNELKPQIILADGSNYKQRVDRWRTRAKQLNQKFLDTYSFGAIETDAPQFKKYF